MKASVELFSSFPLSALTRVLAFTCFYLVALGPALAQDIPRLPDGRPNFNGIWQVINEANWDLEPHIARHSVMMREGGPLIQYLLQRLWRLVRFCLFRAAWV